MTHQFLNNEPSINHSLERWYFLSSFSLLIALIIIGAIHGYTLFALHQAKQDKVRIEQLKSKIIELQSSYALTQKNNASKKRYQRASMLAKILSGLSRLLPTDVRLDTVLFQAGHHMIFKGTAREVKAFETFLSRLQKKPRFAQYVVSNITRTQEREQLTFTLLSPPST